MAIKEDFFLYIHWKYMITKLFGYQQSSVFIAEESNSGLA